jgi:acyl-coenzyme A thioesterase PaaI-like protein
MPYLDEEQRRELLRLVAGLRRAIDASVSLQAPRDELTVLADRAHAFAEALEAWRAGRPVPRYNPPLDPSDPNAMIAFSPATGRYNPLSPPVELAIEPGPRVVGTVAFADAYEGPPSSVHGSVIASVYDQLLAHAAIASDAGGPTAVLTVRYRKLTPLKTPLRFEAWVERIDGRKAFVKGECRAGEDLVSEADAVFVKYSGG